MHVCPHIHTMHSQMVVVVTGVIMMKRRRKRQKKGKRGEKEEQEEEKENSHPRTGGPQSIGLDYFSNTRDTQSL